MRIPVVLRRHVDRLAKTRVLGHISILEPDMLARALPFLEVPRPDHSVRPPVSPGLYNRNIPCMMRDVKKIDRSVLDSQEFRNLVVGRWRISLLLTALLFILYYGYIILIATNRQLVSRPVRGSTTAGILIAAAVIVGAWVLTAAYVVWANRHYDPAVARLRARAEAK